MIYYNGKEVTPKFNNNQSIRVTYNDDVIYGLVDFNVTAEIVSGKVRFTITSKGTPSRAIEGYIVLGFNQNKEGIYSQAVDSTGIIEIEISTLRPVTYISIHPNDTERLVFNDGYPVSYTYSDISLAINDLFFNVYNNELTNIITLPPEEIALADTKAGDVLLWDKTNQRKLFTSSDNLSSYQADSYTPIGVVVVPASHNVYGDGSCGVMSLKPMNCDTPSTGGTSEQSMYWGVYNTNISGLPDLDKVPTGNTSDGIPTSESSYCYLPSDKFGSAQCLHDTDAFYYTNSSSNFGPSPYLTDGSRNPGYYQTSSPSSSSNALADFDGIGNTEKNNNSKRN